MNCDFFKNQKGLSLMEVLVAFMIASMLLLSGVIMLRTAGRLVRSGAEKMTFLQELMYVTTRIEKEAILRDVPDPVGTVFPRILWNGATSIEVQISPVLSYRYYNSPCTINGTSYPNGRVLTEVVTAGLLGSTETVISHGLLWPDIWRSTDTDADIEACLNSMTDGACTGTPVFQLANPRNPPNQLQNRMLLVSFRSSVDRNAWQVSMGTTAPRSARGVTKSVLLSNWNRP